MILLRAVGFAMLAVTSGYAAVQPKPGKPIELPVRCQENMFYAHPVTAEGGIELNFYTDTGGGLFLFESVAKQLHLRETHTVENGQPITQAELPPFRPEASIPPPVEPGGLLAVMPDTQRLPMMQGLSGLLGQAWFAGRVWTFDYPGGKLLWRAEKDVPAVKPEHRVPLGFQSSNGKRDLNFPRVQARIDGEVLDLLFDTGANTELTDAALKTIGDGHDAHRAASFIEAAVYERWHKAHPDWKVIEDAEKGTHSAMIRVPEVQVGGYTVGPVWFTERANKNFDQFMSQFMDKPVVGALGGSAYSTLRITIDYPGAAAYFEKP